MVFVKLVSFTTDERLNVDEEVMINNNRED